MEIALTARRPLRTDLDFNTLDYILACEGISLSTSSPSSLPLTSIPSLIDTIGLYCLGHVPLAYCLCTALVYEI